MRNMSFSLTSAQILNRTKFVTRRIGWRFLKPGDLLQPVRKAMGLKAGEKAEWLGGPIRVVDVRRERLDRMVSDAGYGVREVRLEGFAGHPTKGWPDQFVAFFCASHRCLPGDEITRIEFEYV
jgi:hypothetical protein